MRFLLPLTVFPLAVLAGSATFAAYGGADAPGSCTGAALGSVEQVCGLTTAKGTFINGACVVVSQSAAGGCCIARMYSDEGCTQQVGCLGGDNVGDVLQVDFDCLTVTCDDPPGC